MIKISRIAQLSGGRWRAFSLSGKNLGTYSSRERAEKRLREVEMFKHIDKKKKRRARSLFLLNAMVKVSSEPIMDSVNTYSAVMRDLNKHFPEKRDFFMRKFKESFDSAMIADIENPEDAALMEALQCVDMGIQGGYLDHYMFKHGAAIVDLGTPEVASRYISHVIKFIMLRVAPDTRAYAMENLRSKILDLNANEISTKKTPDTASFGQALTFIKTILNGHSPAYIRSVIEHVVRGLHA